MILVTGASGNIGGELVKRLTDAKVRFRAGYHSKDKADAAKRAGVEAVLIDFTRPATLRPGLEEVQSLFLISGNHPSQTELEINVVHEAKKAGVRHLVKTSVWGAEGAAFSFARIHRPVEKEIEASGIAYTFLRPNGFMQNFVNFLAGTIRAQGAFYLPARQARVSHIDVRDIAGVAARVLVESGHEGKAYDLSGPEALTYDQIAEKLSAVLDRKIVYVDLPDAEFKKSMIGAGAPPAYADAMIDLVHYYIAGQASRVTPAVRQITGKDPIAFDQFAREFARAFR
ncbi:MAG TPA: SDR family oxidoreductase [Candidatus Polarisedimenticolia bacterium]|nr:SDR family oxidoreductase [Candidatus Polarisedimenticolia bacterium]